MGLLLHLQWIIHLRAHATFSLAALPSLPPPIGMIWTGLELVELFEVLLLAGGVGVEGEARKDVHPSVLELVVHYLQTKQEPLNNPCILRWW